MNSGEVSGDQIDQLFLRCQPKQAINIKKTRQRRKLNRNKPPPSVRSRTAKGKQTQKSLVTSESDNDESANKPNSLQTKLPTKNSTNIISKTSDSSKYKEKLNSSVSIAERPTTLNNIGLSSSITTSSSSSNNASSKPKTAKYSASKNLQLQLKSSHNKKNDKTKLSKNTNKDSPLSDENCNDDPEESNTDYNETNKTQKNNELERVNELLDLSPSESKSVKFNVKVRFKDDQNIASNCIAANQKLDTKNEFDGEGNEDKQNHVEIVDDVKDGPFVEAQKNIKKSDSLPSIFKHHKLLNETSHYVVSKDTVVLSPTTTEKPELDKSPTTVTNIEDPLIQLHIYSTEEQTTNEPTSEEKETKDDIIESYLQQQHQDPKPSSESIIHPIHMSTLHFNALSDNESVTDEAPDVKSTTSKLTSLDLNGNHAKNENKICNNHGVKFTRNNTSNLNSSSAKDSSTAVTKSPLVFPKLDEGLSSEAESNHEESNDDDERAVEGDVDADDDEFEEEAEDNDDFEFDNNNNAPSIFSFLPSTTDDTQRSSDSNKSQNRLSLDVTQVSNSSQGIISETMQYSSNSLKQNFTPSNYIDSDMQMDQIKNEYFNSGHIKNFNNNQNGGGPSQTSNYWIDPQQSNSQSLRRRKNNLNNLHKTNSVSFARDDTKSTIRLSSDTDNETDRLLGSQRSEVAKLPRGANNISYNNSKSDSLIPNHMKKEQTNQREGKNDEK